MILEKKLDDATVGRLSRAQAPHGPTIVRDQDEKSWTPEANQDVAAHLQAHIDRPDAVTGAPMGHASLQTKSVVDTGQHRWLLKPYHERLWPDTGEGPPLTGWGEQTSQSLYHAAGIGHLHQQAHVVHVPHQGKEEPFLAIRMAPGYHESLDHHFVDPVRGRTADPDRLRDQALKIGVMDWLGRVPDRHPANLMVDSDHNLLAIDHGLGYSYDPSTDSAADWSVNRQIHDPHMATLSTPLASVGGTTPKAARAVMDWWRASSPAIRATMERRLQLIKHFALRQHIRANFEARASHLDDAVAKDDVGGFWNRPAKYVSTPGLPT